jgi:hypothetical protein
MGADEGGEQEGETGHEGRRDGPEVEGSGAQDGERAQVKTAAVPIVLAMPRPSRTATDMAETGLGRPAGSIPSIRRRPAPRTRASATAASMTATARTRPGIAFQTLPRAARTGGAYLAAKSGLTKACCGTSKS